MAGKCAAQRTERPKVSWLRSPRLPSRQQLVSRASGLISSRQPRSPSAEGLCPRSSVRSKEYRAPQPAGEAPNIGTLPTTRRALGIAERVHWPSALKVAPQLWLGSRLRLLTTIPPFGPALSNAVPESLQLVGAARRILEWHHTTSTCGLRLPELLSRTASIAEGRLGGKVEHAQSRPALQRNDHLRRHPPPDPRPHPEATWRGVMPFRTGRCTRAAPQLSGAPIAPRVSRSPEALEATRFAQGGFDPQRRADTAVQVMQVLGK